MLSNALDIVLIKGILKHTFYSVNIAGYHSTTLKDGVLVL